MNSPFPPFPIPIKVESNHFDSIIGQSNVLFNYCGSAHLMVGGRVNLIEYEADSNRPTGREIERYVTEIVSKVPLHLDDNAVSVRLSPFKPER